jgi:selenide,water dikinase
MVPAGCYRNRDFFGPGVLYPAPCTQQPDSLLPLFDPQTSGGLLIALAPEDARRFLARSEEKGVFACRIGEVLPPSPTHAVEIF